MAWDGNKPNTLPRLEDRRLAELADDRTGWDAIQGPHALSDVETLSLIDELRAWRKYKLTDEEKAALRDVCSGLPGIASPVALAAFDKLLGKAKSHG